VTVISTVQARREALLAQYLGVLFGELDAGTLAFLRPHVQWTEVAAGEALMRQGEPGDCAYLSVGGRLRVYMNDDDGSPRPVRELGRGELIGEMSLFTGEPRSATVMAIRDSVLARLDKPHFEQLLARNPRASIAVTRQIIARLQTQHLRRPVPAPVTVALLPVSAGVDLRAFAERLAGELASHGRVRLVDAAEVDRMLDETGAAAADARDDRRVALALDAFEADSDFVLLLADDAASAWTRRCIRHGDELLLLADATRPPALHPVEQALLAGSGRSEAAQTLVLMHPAERAVPRGMRSWVTRRPVTGHVNIRPELQRDMARLARLLSRKAVGLVLAGGGARGFAHLGIWRALRARGVEIDWVGGTSIGAVMAALIATDAAADTAIEVARRAFRRSPTRDYNLLPLISLIKGRRLREVVAQGVGELVGGPIDIEDLWIGFFCVASNYSQGREQRLSDGDLGRALLASVAIPGALPPVVRDGDLLCDGGTFNNFPVDAMRAMRGVGAVIGVDLGAHSPRRFDFDEVPGSWALLLDRLRPRARRRYRLPSLISYLLNITILYSISRQSEARRLADLYFSPPLKKVGLLQWDRFDEIVLEGERHADEVLEALEPAQGAQFGLFGRDRTTTAEGYDAGAVRGQNT
jgi:NTE family protein